MMYKELENISYVNLYIDKLTKRESLENRSYKLSEQDEEK
jgi:hypothetical protein